MSSTTSVDASLAEQEQSPNTSTSTSGSTGPTVSLRALPDASEQSATVEPAPAESAPAHTPRALRTWAAFIALVALLPAVAVGLGFGFDPLSLSCLAVWALVAARRTATHSPIEPLARQLRKDFRTLVYFCLTLAVAGVVGLVSLADARVSLAMIAAAGLSTMALRRLQPRRVTPRRVVLVGSRADVEAHAASGAAGDLVVGCHVVDADAVAVQPALLVPTTTSLETLDELVASVNADAVHVLPGTTVAPELVRDLTWMFEHTTVTVGIVCPVSSVSAHRLRTTVSGASTVLEVGAPRAGVSARVAKSVVDRVVGTLLLVLSSPVLAMLWLAVRIDTKGPGVFVQTRIGENGKPFRMFKMRTMHHGAESILESLAEENESDGVLFKIRRDPRVTRVGYWLRRSSLDELPQLLNVVRGEMSLVGPRPALPSEVEAYDEVARRRLVVKPGITGLWQVSGRSDLLWEESLRLDLYYADNWRMVDDLSIAARTVAAVTRARGAY
jgi:exopolysaccharide biosynthesis polyprenyl glycosylphosphotransferase